jgi:hypothetical protein
MRIKVLLVLMLAVIATTTNCSAKTPSDKSTVKTIVPTDTIMQKAVGDSIYRIITHTKKIEVAVLSQATDSIKQEVKKKNSAKEFGIINFIATNPKNYISNAIVYGNFIPQLMVTYTLKKEVVNLKYDFGLRKWGVFDAEDKEVIMFDLASDNMLRYVCQQFPDNTFFHELLMTRDPEGIIGDK